MLIVLTTLPKEHAKKLMERILKRKLAACSLAFEVHSIYWWKGKLNEDKEILIIFKTLEELEEEIKKSIEEIHPYSVPFIASFKANVSEKYLDWAKKVLEKNKD